MATDWLRYANQNATRRLPLNDRLVNALGFLPELGVTMEVFSGGQPGKGEGPRVGSTRHDHGNAADVFFYKDGRRLNWASEADRPLFEEIVRRGRAAGVSGFGAGDGYMQPGSMHIGFGSPGVWGAGGRGAAAPSWLRAAYEGGAASPTLANVQNKTFDPVGEVMAAVPGSMAPQPRPNPPVASFPSSTAPTVPASTQPNIPAAVQAVAGAPTTSKSANDVFGMLAMMGNQGPRFSPVQTMGPSPEQATGLLQLVQALKSRIA